MHNIIYTKETVVNDSPCQKIAATKGDGFLELNFLLRHGKFTTVVMSDADARAFIDELIKMRGAPHAGSERVVE